MLQAQVHPPCFCQWQACSCLAESKQGLHAGHTHMHRVSYMSKGSTSTTSLQLTLAARTRQCRQKEWCAPHRHACTTVPGAAQCPSWSCDTRLQHLSLLLLLTRLEG